MKNISSISAFLFIITILISTCSYAQDNVHVITCSEFHITRPLRDLVKLYPFDTNKNYGNKESPDRSHRPPQTFKYTAADGAIYGEDPSVRQTNMGTRKTNEKAAIISWAGQTAVGFRPFDPTGAAGPNHYIQMINKTPFKVYEKSTGNILLTANLSTLWSPATTNEGDPIVMYDKYADRWFLSQFGTTSNKKIYIAISTTNDPTGTYYAYTFTSPEYPDYLKFSIWENGYYMTSNQPTDKVFCFERDQMLVGNPSSRAISVNFTTGTVAAFFAPLPADAADGGLPDAGTPLPFFAYYDNGWAGGDDGINIWDMTVTWGSSPDAFVSSSTLVPTAPFDASYNSGWNDVSQPGTTVKLDGIGGVLTYRAQWRPWPGYNSVVLNWGVLISGITGQRSIRWVELRQDQETGVWSLYQEGTYTPDGDTRWMGSIAMDDNGSIALAYCKSSSTFYPSLCYTGRLASDTLGTMSFEETLVKEGTSSQTTINRFGDYSHTSLDPDGVTFWHTGEYISSGVKTRIYSFQLPLPLASVQIAQTLGTNPSCVCSPVSFTATMANGGTSPSYQWKINGVNTGTNSPVYTTSSLSDGDIVSCVMTSSLSIVTGNPSTSNSIAININSPSSEGLSAGDYIWSGNTCSDWTTASNWITYNGSVFSTVESIPDSSSNIFIRANSCETNYNPSTGINSNISCRNLTIETYLSLGENSNINVHGNWVNNGMFNGNTGTVNFSGNNMQQIKSGGSSFYDVIFNNTNSSNTDINLTDIMIVSHSATFINGILYYTDSGELIFTDGSECPNGGSENSFVNGIVTKKGSDAFIFPTGVVSEENAIWAPVGISTPENSKITAEYIFDFPPESCDVSSICDQSELEQVSGVEYWQMTSDNAYPRLTLYWKDAAKSQITDLTDLCITHWGYCDDYEDYNWSSKGGIAISDGTVSGKNTGHITSAIQFSSYSPVTLGKRKNSNPLPISLISFDATCVNNEVNLSWSTATETNNDYFTIQRSIDMLNWQFVSKVQGAGNSNTVHYYSFKDIFPYQDIIYYRLNQTDYNGLCEYFEPIAVLCDKNTNPEILYYPNIFTDKLIVHIKNILSEDASLVIYDIIGNKVLEKNISKEELGNHIFTLNLDYLSSGLYTLAFSTDNYNDISRVVKKK